MLTHLHQRLTTFFCVFGLSLSATALWAQNGVSETSAKDDAKVKAAAPNEMPEPVEQSKKLPVEVTALDMTADGKTGELVLSDKVVISHGKTRLFADRATFNNQTKQARAEGHVRLRQGYREWTSNSLDYNFETGSMKAGQARAEIGRSLYFQSNTMESSDSKRYVLKGSYLTTSDYDQPGYRLKAATIILYPDNRIAFHHLVLYVGKIPVFYFPYFVLPLDDGDGETFSSGTQVQVGSKGNWGPFILNSYTTRVSDSFRPTYHLDYRHNRGIAGGVDVRYKAGEWPEKKDEEPGYPRVRGKVKTYYAEDSKAQKNNAMKDVVTSTGTFTEKIPNDRYQIRVTQRADITEEVYSKLKVNKTSDANFLEDFFEQDFLKEPQPDSFLEITKWSPNSTLSAMARPQLNNFYTTTERLPEVRFDMPRQSILGTGLFYESENSADYLSKEFSRLTPGLQDYDTTRVDTFHQLLYPKQFFGFLNVTPRVGGRATFYDRSRINASEPSVVRGVLNAGVETTFKLSRTWKGVSNKKWEIDGLRHVVEPSFNYGFVARPTQTPDRLYQFDVDRSSFGVNKNLAPIDFPQYTGIDSINKRNVIRPMLRQRLQTKRDGSTWDLVEALLYQDINVAQYKGEKTFSDLFGELSMRPVRWLELGWVGRYDYDNNQIRESTSHLSVYRKKDWKVELTHSYFRDVGDQVGIGTWWAINENWAFRTNHRFDPSDGSLFSQEYALDRDLHSWIATLSISELRPLNKDPDLRVWLTFTLKAFPEVSLDSRQVGR